MNTNIKHINTFIAKGTDYTFSDWCGSWNDKYHDKCLM